MANEDLLLRQQHLLVRSAELRMSLSVQVQVIKPPLALADQVRSGAQWLYRHPQWPAGALLALVLLRPRRTLVWGRHLWWAWKSLQRLRRWADVLPLTVRR